MITLERPAYYSAQRYSEYCGLSTDDKATIKAENGDEFYEIDTAKFYRYNATSNEWIAQPDDTAPIDTGLPTITSETAGHFLSNDGNVTHWQTVASKNFVIQLTENASNKSYTADKTYVEIKAAFDAKENLVVRLNNSEFGLMNVEFANANEAGFTFGYTEVRTRGQIIVTRAIHYEHSSTEDKWTDADVDTDLSNYLSLEGGTMSGELHLSADPTEDTHAATKRYVDEHNMIVRMSYNATAGIDADKSIQEISNASLAKKYIHAELNGDVFMLTSISAAEATFSKIEENKVTMIVYAEGTWNKREYELLPLKGGTMSGNINMNSNFITNAQKIHVDGSAPIYIGSVIEQGVNAPRLVGSTSGEAAFVKASSQNDYVPVSVGDPTSPNHAVNLRQLTQEVLADAPTADGCIANKKYVDDKIAAYNQRTGDFAVSGNLTVNGIASVIKEPEQNVDVTNKGYVDTQIAVSVADRVKKQFVAVSGSSSVNVPLSNGVYLLTVSDNAHGGLVCVSVFPDGEIISGLVDLNGWKCEKLTSQQGVVLTNVVVSDMTVYITSIGED